MGEIPIQSCNPIITFNATGKVPKYPNAAPAKKAAAKKAVTKKALAKKSAAKKAPAKKTAVAKSAVPPFAPQPPASPLPGGDTGGKRTANLKALNESGGGRLHVAVERKLYGHLGFAGGLRCLQNGGDTRTFARDDLGD